MTPSPGVFRRLRRYTDRARSSVARFAGAACVGSTTSTACRSCLHRLEPLSAVSVWLLVRLLNPIFAATCNPTALDLVKREGVVRANCRMRDTHLRHRGVSLRNDTEHFDRPALRVAAVELDELGPASDPDERVRPLEDEIIRNQLTDSNPVSRLNPAPELRHDLARLHHPIIHLVGVMVLALPDPAWAAKQRASPGSAGRT